MVENKEKLSSDEILLMEVVSNPKLEVGYSVAFFASFCHPLAKVPIGTTG